MPGVNHFERAFRAWAILATLARQRASITYGELAARLGMHHRPLRYVLELIQEYCLQEPRRPPLSILVVDQFGEPGSGFIAWDRGDLDHGKEQVFLHAWETEPNPFEFASQGATHDSLIQDLLTAKRSAADTYSLMRVRGSAQMLFREMMMRVYAGMCAFSGITVATEAAHIVPWSQCNESERLDAQNGLVLSALHHRLFDSGLIRLEEDYSIHASPRLQTLAHRSAGNARLVEQLEGTRLRLPTDRERWPSIQYIRWRLAATN